MPLFVSAGHTLCIDHHVSNICFAQDNYVVPDASSTSELVYNLIDKDKITKEIAEALYLGIVHDTGVFQYSCAGPSTFRAAAELLETGIDAADLDWDILKNLMRECRFRTCTGGELFVHGRKMYRLLYS